MREPAAPFRTSRLLITAPWFAHGRTPEPNCTAVIGVVLANGIPPAPSDVVHQRAAAMGAAQPRQERSRRLGRGVRVARRRTADPRAHVPRVVPRIGRPRKAAGHLTTRSSSAARLENMSVRPAAPLFRPVSPTIAGRSRRSPIMSGRQCGSQEYLPSSGARSHER